MRWCDPPDTDYIGKTGNMLCGLCTAVSMGGISAVLGAVQSPHLHPRQHSSSVGFILVRWAPVESVPTMQILNSSLGMAG